jgi:predicted NUDIX family NTP pyrophosphohydrolase
MPRQSAGILVYRQSADRLEFLLAHPGGPYFANKDDGDWSIPKGEFVDGEDPLTVAQREFEEEIGQPIAGRFTPLRPIKQKGGKIVYAWLVEGDLDVSHVHSNTFTIEWPPKSGKRQEFPEVDRAAWFDMETAARKIKLAQLDLLLQAEALIRS